MSEIAGLLIGIALVRLAAPREALLRAAIVAQAADLATFAIAWQGGAGERNPLSRLALDLSFALFGPAEWVAVPTAALSLMGLKVALIGFLIHVAPHLGRYRRIVLGAAIGVGAIGAISNLLAYPNAGVPLSILAVFLVIAIRWPSRFGDAVGVSVRLVVSACFALAGFAALAYLPYASVPFMCGSAVCSPALGTLLVALAVTSFVAATIVLLMTVRFSARVLSEPPRPGAVISPWSAKTHGRTHGAAGLERRDRFGD